MEACYETLLTIYAIVKADPAPQTYLCSAHEIILRHPHGWDIIQTHLDQLEKESLVIVKHLDKIAVSITESGILKSRNLKNNFIANSFSFSNEKQILTPDKMEG